MAVVIVNNVDNLSSSLVNRSWIERIWKGYFGFYPFHGNTHINSQTAGYYYNWRESLESTLTQTIWLSLYKVSVVSLCGTGPTAALFSALKSITEAPQIENWQHTDFYRESSWIVLCCHVSHCFQLMSFTFFSDSLCAFGGNNVGKSL